MLKNKTVFCLVTALSLCGVLQAEITTNIEEKNLATERDELAAIDHLIIQQQRHLAIQIELKEMMQEFQKQKEEFMQGKQTQKHAIAMVSNAREILSAINEEHIAHLFPAEYLEELVFFSSVAGKSRPTRP